MEISREDFLNYKRTNKLNDTEEVFAKFEGKSIVDIIDITLDCVEKSLNAANVKAEEIDEIFLVGGSSALPIVYEKIKEKFNKEPFKSKISPALSISRGAAYYCNMIMMPTIKGPIVHEKTIHPLGLEIAGRRFMEIVRAGLDIPKENLVIEAEEPLITNFDNVSSMAIVVYENTLPGQDEKDTLVTKDGMKRLAGTSLRGIPMAPKGEEKVKVIFTITQDNMLKVTAKSMSDDGVVTELSVDELY